VAFCLEQAQDVSARIGESGMRGNMALVHHHGPDRGHDMALMGLAILVIAIIAAAVPFLRLCVDSLFGFFQ